MVTRPATLPAVAIALVALSLLAGCSAPVSVANDTSAGSPPGFDGSGGLLNGAAERDLDQRPPRVRHRHVRQLVVPSRADVDLGDR